MRTFNKNRVKGLFCAFVVSFMTISSYAQSNKKWDSLVKLSSRLANTDPDKAIKIGLAIVNGSGNSDYKLKGYSVISYAYSVKRYYEKSLEYDIKANQLLKLTKNDLIKINFLNISGVRYQQLNIYDKAIKSLDQAEQLIMKYPIQDSVHISYGINYIARGLIYKEKLDTDLAISLFDKGVSELLKSKTVVYSNYYLSVAKYNRGNCYRLKSKFKLALSDFSQAMEHAKIVNANNQQAFALKGMAEVYTDIANYSKAIQLLKEAMSYSSGTDDLILYRGIYGLLAENYLASGNLEAYKVNYLKYRATDKKLDYHEQKSVNDSLNEKANELKIILDTETKWFYLAIISLSLLLIVMVIFLYSIAKKKLKNIEIKRAEINMVFKK